MQTSTITVVVLQESKKINIKIDPKDLEYKYCLSSGPGGQNVQKNMTAVTLTHKPTGLKVRVETKSQQQNKIQALNILKSRLTQKEAEAASLKRNNHRRSQLGKGDRSDKRRTIAVQRNEVVDHKTGKKMKYKNYERGQIEKLH